MLQRAAVGPARGMNIDLDSSLAGHNLYKSIKNFGCQTTLVFVGPTLSLYQQYSFAFATWTRLLVYAVAILAPFGSMYWAFKGWTINYFALSLTRWALLVVAHGFFFPWGLNFWHWRWVRTTRQDRRHGVGVLIITIYLYRSKLLTLLSQPMHLSVWVFASVGSATPMYTVYIKAHYLLSFAVVLL